MRTLLREPLVHFAVAGAVLFALQAWRGQGGVDDDAILVSLAILPTVGTTADA